MTNNRWMAQRNSPTIFVLPSVCETSSKWLVWLDVCYKNVSLNRWTPSSRMSSTSCKIW